MKTVRYLMVLYTLIPLVSYSSDEPSTTEETQEVVKIGDPESNNKHYVDDSINLGGNYTRMKHVVSSLFPHSAVQGKECVKVNIFKNVIVLLNRMSASSICDYVSDINHYFYYLDLRISSMRTHEDACYLCKEESNSEKISEASGTNQMSVYWEEQKKKFKKMHQKDQTT